MEIIYGDILLSEKDIIIQQVNCRGFMGKGLAETILRRYPEVKKEYQRFRKSELKKVQADEDLLGLVNYVDVYDNRIIANVFGQVDIRKDRNDKTVYTKKEALLKGIQSVEEKARALNLSVAIPTYIGYGLAGGDWNEIKLGIEYIFKESPVDVTLYEYR